MKIEATKRVVVELERPSGGHFTYEVPKTVRVGQRVVVPYGNAYPTIYTGRVVDAEPTYDGLVKAAIGLAFR